MKSTDLNTQPLENGIIQEYKKRIKGKIIVLNYIETQWFLYIDHQTCQLCDFR